MVGTVVARAAGGAVRFHLDFHPVDFGGGESSAMRLPSFSTDGLLGSTSCALMVQVHVSKVGLVSSVEYIRFACVEQMSADVNAQNLEKAGAKQFRLDTVKQF